MITFDLKRNKGIKTEFGFNERHLLSHSIVIYPHYNYYFL